MLPTYICSCVCVNFNRNNVHDDDNLDRKNVENLIDHFRRFQFVVFLRKFWSFFTLIFFLYVCV